MPNTAGRKAAQKRYNAKPEQKKRRAQRNKARRELMRQGKVHKGDGRDVDHKDGNTAHGGSNLRILRASLNRHYNRRSKRTKAPKKL